MSEQIKVPTIQEVIASGNNADVLFWVGCAGSFDDRAKKITKAIVKHVQAILQKGRVMSSYSKCRHFRIFSY